MTVVFYPGYIDATTTNTTGPGLVSGISQTTTTFTIQARDTESNYRYNGGADWFHLKLTGISDWAGDGRIDEGYVGKVTAGTPHDIPLNQTSRDWTLVCSTCASATHGAYDVSTQIDLRGLLDRGMEIVIGNGKKLR
jgi:hypothetical protein